MQCNINIINIQNRYNCWVYYLKNVESASVATALAKYDFPVPGGPYKRKALHGRLFPKTESKFGRVNQIKFIGQLS